MERLPGATEEATESGPTGSRDESPGYVHIQGLAAAVEQSVSTKAPALEIDTFAGTGSAKVLGT